MLHDRIKSAHAHTPTEWGGTEKAETHIQLSAACKHTFKHSLNHNMWTHSTNVRMSMIARLLCHRGLFSIQDICEGHSIGPLGIDASACCCEPR